MAKYRKVYDSELQDLFDAVSLTDSISITGAKEDISFLYRLFWQLEVFFDIMDDRDVLEDDE